MYRIWSDFLFLLQSKQGKFVPSNSPWPPSEGNKTKRKIVVPAYPFWHHQKKQGVSEKADPSNTSWPHRKTFIGRWLSLHFFRTIKKIPKRHKLKSCLFSTFLHLSWPHQKLETNWKMVVPSKVFARAHKKKTKKGSQNHVKMLSHEICLGPVKKIQSRQVKAVPSKWFGPH